MKHGSYERTTLGTTPWNVLLMWACAEVQSLRWIRRHCGQLSWKLWANLSRMSVESANRSRRSRRNRCCDLSNAHWSSSCSDSDPTAATLKYTTFHQLTFDCDGILFLFNGTWRELLVLGKFVKQFTFYKHVFARNDVTHIVENNMVGCLAIVNEIFVLQTISKDTI